MPTKAADRLVADVGRRDNEGLPRALEPMADLELESRGGGGGASARTPRAVTRRDAAARP